MVNSILYFQGAIDPVHHVVKFGENIAPGVFDNSTIVASDDSIRMADKIEQAYAGGIAILFARERSGQLAVVLGGHNRPPMLFVRCAG